MTSLSFCLFLISFFLGLQNSFFPNLTYNTQHILVVVHTYKLLLGEVMLKLFSLIRSDNPRSLENKALESNMGKAFHASFTSAREPDGYILI